MPSRITPPTADEYAPFYAGYIARVAGGDLIATLARQPVELRALLAEVSEGGGAKRYAEGKWSVKEVLGHIADTERVMSYRMLRVARADATPLPGFDQDSYVLASDAGGCTLSSLQDELDAVRASTLALVRNASTAAWGRRGVANGYEVSARALAHIIAGHWAHHVEMLGSRYGLGSSARR